MSNPNTDSYHSICPDCGYQMNQFTGCKICIIAKSRLPTESFEDQLNRISGDIDQVTVQKIFKKLATGNKKRDDALWALTSEAAREIRQLVKGDILAAHQATTDRRVAEAVQEARIDALKPYAEQFKARLTSQEQEGFEFHWGTKLLTEYEQLTKGDSNDRTHQ